MINTYSGLLGFLLFGCVDNSPLSFMETKNLTKKDQIWRDDSLKLITGKNEAWVISNFCFSGVEERYIIPICAIQTRKKISFIKFKTFLLLLLTNLFLSSINFYIIYKFI